MFVLALIVYGGSVIQTETVSLDSPSYTCQSISELSIKLQYVTAASISDAPALCGGLSGYG